VARQRLRVSQPQLELLRTILRALESELKGNTSEAARQWKIVFGGNYPG